MKKTNVIWLFFLTAIFTVSSCKKDDTYIPADIEKSKGFYILNEGIFTQGNASLSFFDYDNDTVYNNLFEGINNRVLGDVFQSMTFYNGKGYLVVNNSGKIEVVDSASMKSIRTVENFTSPRKIFFYGDKAYVSDLYSNKIYVLDANTLNEIKSIEIDGSAEDIEEANGKLLIAVNQSFEYTDDNQQGILVINPQADTVENYIKLSEGAIDIEVDKTGNIWVYCTGHWSDPDATGKLHKLNGNDYSVSQTFDFGKLAYFASPLRLNKSKDVLYFALAGDPSSYTDFNIHRMPVHSSSLPTDIFFSGAGRYIYGYHFDETRNELIILDAIDGGQKGELVRINSVTDEVLGTYEVGYFPRGIVFKY